MRCEELGHTLVLKNEIQYFVVVHADESVVGSLWWSAEAFSTIISE
jgi:hypothetical protein